MILPIYSAAITYIPPPLKQSPRRQHGRVVRALEFQFGGPKFKVRLHYYLDMFSLVTSDYPYKSLFFKRLAQRTKIYAQVSFYLQLT